MTKRLKAKLRWPLIGMHRACGTIMACQCSTCRKDYPGCCFRKPVLNSCPIPHCPEYLPDVKEAEP